MKKTIRLLPAALAVISAGFFAACDDDSDKLDNPLTTLHATGWTFSPAECQEACIGEIRTRDDEPQINAYSDNEDVEVTVAKMAGKDDGMFVYKVLVSLPERTAPSLMKSEVMIEVVDGTHERLSKVVEICQSGLLAGMTNSSLAGQYTLSEERELDPEDGEYEISHSKSAMLEFTADGKVTVTGAADIDEFRPGTYSYTISGNAVTFGNPAQTFTVMALDASGMTLEHKDMKGAAVDEYTQFVFEKK